MNGFRKGLPILLSALPALVLLIVLTGSWRMLLTPAVIAFLKDVMRMLWCGLLFGVGMSVFLFVAFTMFDHAKDSFDVLPVLKHRDSNTCCYRVEVSHVMAEASFPR